MRFASGWKYWAVAILAQVTRGRLQPFCSNLSMACSAKELAAMKKQLAKPAGVTAKMDLRAMQPTLP
eukprot:4127847-Amphidinium_carterae.2